MTNPNAVVVPVRLSALAVTDPVRGTPFRRTRFDFSSAAEAGSAHRGLEPLPTDPAAPENGVVLHWELTAALRHQDTGSAQPPRVPDRWLVIRLHTPSGASTRSATGWLVQSDCLRPENTPAGDNSAYAIPSASDPSLLVPKRIGRVLKLSENLTEPSEAAPLTALGPGLLEFAAFQPFNLGVFSLHDRLEGLPTDTALDLSYAVVGWHGDSARDPLAPAKDAAELKKALARLGWTAAEASAVNPYPGTRAVYAGNLVGVAWKKDAHPAAALEEKPKREKITFAVAESSAETLSAMAMATDPAEWSKEENLRRLQTLQYGLLDKYSDPSTRAAVQRRAHLARFEPVDGGYTWDILARPAKPGTPPPPFSQLRPEERAWLASANATQAAHDAERRSLARRQERLYELWWYLAQVAWLRSRLHLYISNANLRKTYNARLGTVLSTYTPQLDPAQKDSAAWRVAELQKKLKGYEKIFTATDPAALKAAVKAKTEELTKKWGHAPSGAITRLSRPPFHTATEPVVMLRGAKADRLVEHPTAQPCRTVTAADDHQLAAKVNGAAPAVPALTGLDKAAALPGARDLPSGLFQALLTEFTALDAGRPPATVTFRSSETAVDWNAAGDVRLAALRAQRASWRQPWTPIYLEWRVRYYAVPYHDRRKGKEKERNWEFTDGMYQWRGAGHTPSGDDTELVPRAIKGRILLSANAVHNIRRRYGGMAEDVPAQPASFTAALKKLMDSGPDLDLIAQALDGFTARLTGRTPLLTRPSRGLIASLIADRHGQAPDGLIPNMNRPENPKPEDYLSPPPFEPLRAGQFYFEAVAVVDRFGRSIDIVNPHQGPAERDKPTRSATLLPDDRLDNGKPNGKADAIVFTGDAEYRKKELVHLRPRLVQPARLNFDALSRTGDTPVTRPLDGDQISGWLLPNDFDQGLLFYDHEGLLLGGLRRDPAAPAKLVWEKYAAADPGTHLAGIRDGLTGHTAPWTAMQEFLLAAGAARTTIGPEAESSARHPSLHMLGRPLAVVRARLDLEGDAGAAVPIHPALLAAADPAPVPDYRDHTWPVLLGSTRSAHDGLVGYYIASGADTYKALYTVPEPAKGTVYTRSRANGAALGQSLKAAPHTLTLLADPWAPVHAWTHVLPAAELRLEPEAVQAALARMEAVFHVGPAVGTLRASERKGEDGRPLVDAFSLPLPAVEHGTWSWTDAGSTAPVPLTPADPVARIAPRNRTHVRTGLLRLRPERKKP
ncbi:hypothetical protein [Nocardiopsis potens]|uniref:hypothetical protein n=1 Tax=Nocardiopsis potens TaxID=1246458 RepID=UPI000344F5DC|nr:hypothetical protein [Nocardiopsis potens]